MCPRLDADADAAQPTFNLDQLIPSTFDPPRSAGFAKSVIAGPLTWGLDPECLGSILRTYGTYSLGEGGELGCGRPGHKNHDVILRSTSGIPSPPTTHHPPPATRHPPPMIHQGRASPR